MVKKASGGRSVAEELRLATEDILRREERKTGKPKMDWREYEQQMAELLQKKYGLKLNRGFLLGLLLVKKNDGQFQMTLRLRK